MLTRARATSLVLLSLICLVSACDDDDDPPPPEGEPVRIYWVETPGDCSSSTIWQMDLEGSGPVEVITLPGPDQVADLVVDDAAGKVYFTYSQSSANDTETVQRVNIDGSGLETIATYTEPEALTPRGITLDPTAGYVYWLATGNCSECPACGPCSRIQRSDLTGANPTLIKILEGSHTPSSTAVDPAENLLYWSDSEHEPHIQTV